MTKIVAFVLMNLFSAVKAPEKIATDQEAREYWDALSGIRKDLQSSGHLPERGVYYENQDGERWYDFWKIIKVLTPYCWGVYFSCRREYEKDIDIACCILGNGCDLGTFRGLPCGP